MDLHLHSDAVMKKRVQRASALRSTDRLTQQLKQAASFHLRGDLVHAERLFEQLLREHPGHHEVLSTYGCFLKGTNRLAEAVCLLERAVHSAPGVAAHWIDLGAACQDAGNAQAAMEAYRKALSLDPAFWQAYFNIGCLLEKAGELEQASNYYKYAVQIKSDWAPLWFCLGTAYSSLHRVEEANLCFAESATLSPSGAAYCNLSQGLLSVHQIDAALAAAQKAVELDPGLALAHSHKGRAYAMLGNVSEAKKAFETALTMDGNCPPALAGMASVQAALCYWHDAIPLYVRALEVNQGENRAKIHSEMLLNLGRASAVTPERMLEEHRRWQELYCSGVPRFVHSPAGQDPRRKLNVGFVSGDFRLHAVRSFIAPVLRHLDRAQFAVTCYSNTKQNDTATEELRAVADSWVEVFEMNDDQLAVRIQRDRIDILVDLSGHTYANRLPVFARKPAPIQVTYLGYANTTGLDTMDYWLTDEVVHPEGTPQQTSERIWRLPRCWVGFEPLTDSPDVTMRGAEAVTFVSFNSFQKIGPETLRLWAGVLEAVPGSRLLLKSQGLSGADEQALQLKRLGECGVPAERVSILGYVTAKAEHLALYGQADIGLDPYPYSGATTTAEALWMGVPVVTRVGDAMASRMSASMLHAAALDEFIARDDEEYVRIAAGLAANAEKRDTLRRELRGRLAASPLCDGVDLAREIGSAFRDMWAAWVSAPEQTP